MGNTVFQSTDRAAKAIWEKNMKPQSDAVKEVKSASLEAIKAIPELQDKWPEYERLFLRNPTETGMYSKAAFEKIFRLVNSNSEVSIGRMFDKVLNNLQIAKGEYRLIGSTAEAIGKTTFDPASTQIDQQTLVVVHLAQGSLPTAKPDLNSLEEFFTRSSIDYENDTLRREKEAAEAAEALENGGD